MEGALLVANALSETAAEGGERSDLETAAQEQPVAVRAVRARRRPATEH
jgi:hypothetical protein